MLNNIVVKYLITFILGMCPIIEIRGAIPVGVGLGLTYFQSFLVGFIGNIIPIYFIFFFIYIHSTKKSGWNSNHSAIIPNLCLVAITVGNTISFMSNLNFRPITFTNI